MISTLGTSQNPPVETSLGNTAIPLAGGFYGGSLGPHLNLASATYQDDGGTGSLSLNSLIRSSNPDFAGYQAAVNRIAHGQVFFPGVNFDALNRSQLKDGGSRSLFQMPTNDMDEESNSSSNIDQGINSGNGKNSSKVCRVCGDRALGYNFNVVSCESCKAFFRRNALKPKEFRCPFNEKCDVTALSRRFCQKCRLKKCFEVGMKKEWIMSEEQRQQKRKRIEENRQKRRALKSGKGGGGGDDVQKTEPPERYTPTGTVDSNQQTQQQLYANAGFSPVSKPHTSPMVVGLGSDFSPPDSIDQAQPHSLEDRARIAMRVGNNSTSEGRTSVSSNNSMSVSQDTMIGNGPHECERDFATTLDLRRQRTMPSQESESENLYSQLTSKSASLQPRFPAENFDGAMFGQGIFSPLSASSYIGSGLPSDYNRCSLTTPVYRHPDPIDFDSMITIPKAVLINLIKQCHSTMQRDTAFGPSSMESVTPIVARAHRLCASDGITGEKDDAYECICRCSCGARAAGCNIGPKLVDKGVGPDVDEHMELKEELKERADTRELMEEQSMSHAEMVHFDGGDDGPALTPFENMKIRELFFANQVMDEDPDYSKMGNEQKPMVSQTAADASGSEQNEETMPCMSASQMIEMTDVCVRRIIKMCKRISGFKKLSQDDQIALLKGGCTELMVLRGVMTFIPEKDSWRPVGWKNSLLSLDVLKFVKGNVYEEHKGFLHSFRQEWRSNNSIMLCLTAITLFNPERANLMRKDVVEKERNLYMSLLQRYLDLMYGTQTMASQEAFHELVNRVKTLGTLNDYTATVFLDLNRRDVEPLLIEVFDLK